MSVKQAMKSAAARLLRPVGLDEPARKLWWRLRGWTPPKTTPYPSETSRCRDRLAPYCVGYGVDLGFGGDPIAAHAIRVDFPQPYAYTGDAPVQLGGQAESLHWFRDGVLDFVYSSHLLEDYPDTEAVLREWLRVLKPGGRLIIFCPDEPAYRRHCAATGHPYNTHHVHATFSLAFVKAVLERIAQTKVLHEIPLIDVYSWELVCEKTERSDGAATG